MELKTASILTSFLFAPLLAYGAGAPADECLLYGTPVAGPALSGEEEEEVQEGDPLQVVAILSLAGKNPVPRRLEGLGHPYAMQPTPAGTVLVTVADPSGVPEGLVELDAGGHALWSWNWPAGFSGISYTRAARVLANGDVLLAGYVGEPRPGGWEGGVVVRMTRAGKIVRKVALEPFSHLGAVRLLDDETLLVAASEVYEIGWDGKRRRTWPVPKGKQYRDALPLTGGRLAVAAGQGTLSVFDSEWTSLWTATHASVLSIQELPEGRLFVTG